MIPAILLSKAGTIMPVTGGAMLITLLIALVVLAIIFWLVKDYLVPMLPDPIGKIVLIILVVIAIVILLGFVGVGPGIGALK